MQLGLQQLGLNALMRIKHSRLSAILEDKALPDYNREPIPKIVWIYWDSGEPQAPPIVKRCIQSWRENMKGWHVQVIDDTTIHQHISTTGLPKNVSKTKLSNAIRLRLLSAHGGIWADATTFCMPHFNYTVPLITCHGFFAFCQPAPKRPIATWFLASQPGHYLVERYRDVYEPFLIKYGETYKFAFQYTFDFLVRSEMRFRRHFHIMPKISANPSLEIERWHRDPERWQTPEIDSVLIHKLSWKTQIDVAELERILKFSRRDYDAS